MIERAKRILKNAILGTTVEKAKAAGIHIYRPVINADKWAEWLVAAGVPEPKSAEDMKVSVITMLGQYQVIPNDDPHVVRSEACVFGVIGGKLVAIWYDYGYYDRHWLIRDLVGYDACCTTRAMLVLSDAPGDFVFSDDSLRSVPRSIALNGEMSEVIDTDATTLIMKSAKAATVTPDAAMKQKAADALVSMSSSDEPDPLAQARLYEISKGHPFNPAEASEEIGKETLKSMGLDAGFMSLEDKEKLDAISKSVEKSEARKIKSDDESQIIYVWASVSSKDGEQVIDFHDDTVDVRALHDACTLVVKGARSGAFEHGPEMETEIVSAFVLDKPMQKALSAFSTSGDIELDREGLLVGIHVPDPDRWREVKDGDWEASINATAYVEARA